MDDMTYINRKSHLERYVEVVGEGSFEEHASRFIALVTIEIRSDNDGSAERQVKGLLEDTIDMIKAAGMVDKEIVEGGPDFYRPWYSKKKGGRTASRYVTLTTSDQTKLFVALEKLEPLQSPEQNHKVISVEMKRPEFANSAYSKALALNDAFKDAESKASGLAMAMKCSLDRPLFVEEIGCSRRDSSDVEGDGQREGHSRLDGTEEIALSTAGKMEPSTYLDWRRPSRTISIKCRVRFSIREL